MAKGTSGDLIYVATGNLITGNHTSAQRCSTDALGNNAEDARGKRAIAFPKRMARCIRGLRESPIGVVVVVVVDETFRWHVIHAI